MIVEDGSTSIKFLGDTFRKIPEEEIEKEAVAYLDEYYHGWREYEYDTGHSN